MGRNELGKQPDRRVDEYWGVDQRPSLRTELGKQPDRRVEEYWGSVHWPRLQTELGKQPDRSVEECWGVDQRPRLLIWVWLTHSGMSGFQSLTGPVELLDN